MWDADEATVEGLLPELGKPRIPLVGPGAQRAEVGHEVGLRRVGVDEADGAERLGAARAFKGAEVEVAAAGAEDEGELATDARPM